MWLFLQKFIPLAFLGFLLFVGGVIFWIDANYISKMRFGRRSEKKPVVWIGTKLCLCDMSCGSSLDANAETSVAKGMMQLTEGAWSDARNFITDRHSNGKPM